MGVCRLVGVSAAMIILAVSAVTRGAGPATITADQAREFVGKRVTVCGEIVAIGRALAKRSGGKQTFLHFDKEPPGSPFVAVIMGHDLEAYWDLDKALHRKACATGYVKNRDGLIYTAIDAVNQLTITATAAQ